MPGIRGAVQSALDEAPVTPTGLLLLAPGMIVTDAFYQLTPALPLAMRMGAAIAGWLVLCATLGVAWWLLLRRLRPGPWARVATVVAFTVGGVVRELVVLSLGQPQDPAVSPILWLAARAASTALWLTAAAIIVDWQRRSSQQVARLGGELQRLSDTRDEAALELARTRAQLADVRTRVTEAIDAIRRALVADSSPPALESTAGQLAAAVDDLVRPSSHQLARAQVRLRVPQPAVDVRQSWREQALGIARAWPGALPFQPVAVAWISIPLSVTMMAIHPLSWASTISVAGIGVQLVLLWAADRALPARLVTWPAPIAMSVVALVYAVLLVVGLVSLTIATDLGAPRLPQAALLPFVTAVTVGGASAVHAERRRAELATETVISETEWSVSRIKEQLWAERRRLAITLHGHVQATLTACEVLIRNWLANPALLPSTDLLSRIDDSLVGLADLTPPPLGDTVESAGARIASVWEGILAVRWSVSADARAALDSDPDCQDATLEALRELLLNAVRHGGATRAEVSVVLLNGRTVRLTVVETGSPRTPAPRLARNEGREPGIGLALLDDISLDWLVRQLPDRRITDVLLATTGASGATR